LQSWKDAAGSENAGPSPEADPDARYHDAGPRCCDLVSNPFNTMKALETKALEATAAWRRMGNIFLGVVVPIFHFTGGFFILEFFLSADYTWGRSLRILVLFLSNVIMGYEFVYRELQVAHPHWPGATLKKGVMRYSVIPFSAGMTAVLVLQVVRYWAR
jgi:hypothetical protein